jgi:hypothetical protein
MALNDQTAKNAKVKYFIGNVEMRQHAAPDSVRFRIRESRAKALWSTGGAAPLFKISDDDRALPAVVCHVERSGDISIIQKN